MKPCSSKGRKALSRPAPLGLRLVGAGQNGLKSGTALIDLLARMGGETRAGNAEGEGPGAPQALGVEGTEMPGPELPAAVGAISIRKLVCQLFGASMPQIRERPPATSRVSPSMVVARSIYAAAGCPLPSTAAPWPPSAATGFAPYPLAPRLLTPPTKQQCLSKIYCLAGGPDHCPASPRRPTCSIISTARSFLHLALVRS